MRLPVQTPESQRANAEIVISKQLYYLRRTLLVNLNFADKQHLLGLISENDRNMIVEMNRDLLDVLNDVSDDYQGPS